MPKHLVVVESPAKAKTIEKYLGKTYKVVASYGHVRDLVPKEGAVDPDHDFSMHYQAIERNARHVEAIAKALKSADTLYIATDPDREGEAIAWHIKQLLDDQLSTKQLSRVVFHQITKRAIEEAIAHPRDISMDLVNAQQARRALDYLVGFNLSPLLWKKIRPGLSAGRVQSPALRMIVERDVEIENFKSQEYWTIHAELGEDPVFKARLIEYQKEKVEQFTFTSQTQVQSACQILKKAGAKHIIVTQVTKKERKRHPTPPFITSTLQQESARKLGFSASKTMQIAQQLYEGVELGEEGAAGLITYMRTDSVTLAQEALDEIRSYIVERYGSDYLPEQPRVFKTKSKNAQEAHEAIRPTTASRVPEDVKKYLSTDQFKLYSLIWKRAVASQMVDATLNTIAVDFSTPDQQHVFRVNGSSILHPGFIILYQESFDDAQKNEEDGEHLLPNFTEGQTVICKNVAGEQHFTEPPPRYTEASLVKALEENDIGRPSTYASILATLKNRKYVDMDSKRFKATDVGRIVNRFLTQFFKQYVDYGFTANLEDELDAISRGEKEWIPLLKEFWVPFKQLVDYTEQNVKRSDVTQEKLEDHCPKCQAQLSIRLGKRGRFIGCTAYPNCDYTRDLESSPEDDALVAGRTCPTCQSKLIIKVGRYGKFIGCSGYPNCRYMEPLEKPKDTGVTCPACREGVILQRKSRAGKIFYSCSRYPDCTYALWNEPINEACPRCGWPILTIKTTQKRGSEKICPQKNCNYTTNYLER